ncbi:hypothetical protein J6590_059125 [Homalodisca vitripennis]|nr:hypothetical protein J6590_059125 [Homalodisca vitripennis]
MARMNSPRGEVGQDNATSLTDGYFIKLALLLCMRLSLSHTTQSYRATTCCENIERKFARGRRSRTRSESEQELTQSRVVAATVSCFVLLHSIHVSNPMNLNQTRMFFPARQEQIDMCALSEEHVGTNSSQVSEDLLPATKWENVSYLPEEEIRLQISKRSVTDFMYDELKRTKTFFASQVSVDTVSCSQTKVKP